MKKIILVGFMGSGKSTIGKELAKEINLPFFEMDAEIEKKAKKSISTIFERDGETYFRQLETDTLQEVLTHEGIIATGGGTVTKKENADLLEEAETVIYLKGQIDNLIANIVTDTKNKRPLADSANRETLANLLEKREPHYKKVADIIITLDGKKIEEIVGEIVTKLKGMES